MADKLTRTLTVAIGAAVALLLVGCARQGPVGADLTAGRPWEYRAVVGPPEAEAPGPWRANLEEALTDAGAAHEPADFPVAWSAFGPLAGAAWLPIDGLKAVPQAIEHKGRTLPSRAVRADARGEVDLEKLFARGGEEATGYLLAEVASPGQRVLTVHVASDCGLMVWLDGERVFRADAGHAGSPRNGRAAQFALPMTAGRHLLAIRLHAAGGARWSLIAEATRLVGARTRAEGGAPFAVEARRAFPMPDPTAWASLTLYDVGLPLPALNGEPVELPMPDMRFGTIRGLPASLLRAGRNELTVRWSGAALAVGVPATTLRHFAASPAAELLRPTGDLFALAGADVAVDLGPILGAAGEDFFTVTCRTNTPAEVTLGFTLAGREKPVLVRAEGRGLYHRVRVQGHSLREVTSYWLALRAGEGLERNTEAVHLPRRRPGPLRFAAVGDPQSGPHWKDVAAAIERARPDFVIILGDLVGRGRVESEWRDEFWAPAKSLLATTPTYPILGNHDNNAPIFGEIFHTPDGGEGRSSNWAQAIGDVLVVGIDGQQSFRAGTDNHAWLERTLALSEARFIFLCSHYPPWSSAKHGADSASGKAREWTAEQGRQIIMPLLRQHHATAMLTGHEHSYERNEPPGGVSHVTTAGGGLGARRKTSRAAEQNPYSVVFDRRQHFCLFEVTPEKCTMTAVATDGSVIDTRAWPARVAPTSQPGRTPPPLAATRALTQPVGAAEAAPAP